MGYCDYYNVELEEAWERCEEECCHAGCQEYCGYYNNISPNEMSEQRFLEEEEDWEREFDEAAAHRRQ